MANPIAACRPVFTSQFHQWCVDNYHPVTQGIKMNWTLLGDAVLAVVVGLACYEIGKRGLVASYTWVRNLFAKPAVASTQPA